MGSSDVVSLGLTGSIELRFDDNVIVNRAGVDFTVFENPILIYNGSLITESIFAEPAKVSVSQDGVHWVSFPCTLTLGAGPYWPGCAGIYPVLSDGTTSTPHASIPTSVPIQDLMGLSIFSFPTPAGSGGDSFDLAEVGLHWASYVRIEAADFDAGPVGSNNAGFDLDAVVAIHSAWAQKLPTLSGPGLILLCAVLCLVARTSLRDRR